jgi:hypothetical protein
MMTHKMRRLIVAVLCSFGAVSLAAAQDPDTGRRNRQAGAGREAGAPSVGELVNMLDTYAIVQAQTALSLDDSKYGEFVNRLKRLQQTRRRTTRARNQILGDLRRLTQAGTPVDETAIRERLKALRDHDEQAAAEMRKAYDDLDRVLDARQQARFRIFEEAMERKKLDLLMRAQQNRTGRGDR